MPDLDVPVAFVPQASHGLPGRLGFAPAPGRWRPEVAERSGDLIQEDLASLRRACDASVLVTLLERDEMAKIGLADLLERARRSGFECLWFPIPDGTAPSNLEATAPLVARVLERLAAGRTVIVHCHGGVGRSGTIAACALVGAGREPGLALEIVRAARAAAATAPGQEAFVYDFARARGPSPGEARSTSMRETIRRVDYFYFWIEDRPGEGTRILGKLKDARVNVLSFTAFPSGGGKAQLTVVPEDPEDLVAAAKVADIHVAGRKECFFVEGDDHVGAAHDVLRRLADAGINCVAANGCAPVGGTFGMVIFVKPGDLPAAARVLGA